MDHTIILSVFMCTKLWDKDTPPPFLFSSLGYKQIHQKISIPGAFLTGLFFFFFGTFLTGLDDTQFREAAKGDNTALLKVMANYGKHCSEECTFLISCHNTSFFLFCLSCHLLKN